MRPNYTRDNVHAAVIIASHCGSLTNAYVFYVLCRPTDCAVVFCEWHCILLVGWFIDCLYYINLFSCIAASLSDKLTFLLLLSAGWPPTLKPNQPSWTVSSPISCCRPHTTSTTLDVYRLTGRSVWKAELTRDGRHVPSGGSSHCGVLHKHTTAHGEIRDVSLGPLV